MMHRDAGIALLFIHKSLLANAFKCASLLLLFVLLSACSDAARDASRTPDIKPPEDSKTALPSPTNVTVSTTNGVVTIDWPEVSLQTGGTPSYNIYWNTTGNVTTADNLLESVIPPYIVEGLTAGETYYFIVTTQLNNEESQSSFEIYTTAPFPVLVRLSIEPGDHAVVRGNTVQYIANGAYSDGTNIDLTTAVNWKSENNSIIIIDDNSSKGLATTLTSGIATISATDPISKLTATTTLTGQIDHTSFDINLTCSSGGCHQLPATHLNTSDICDACHSLGTESLAWSPLASNLVDHLQVFGVCYDCHDGVSASYKNEEHGPTTDNCEKCHRGEDWIPLLATDHNETLGTCINCHDGKISRGKPATHILSTDNCNACHKLYPATWAPVSNFAVDHNETIGSCFSCHNGVIASGKPTLHVDSSNVCDDCHTIFQWLIN